MKKDSQNLYNILLIESSITNLLGSIFVSVTALAAIFCAFYIQYPDYIESDVKIVNELGTIRLFNKAAGEIKVVAQDKDTVQKGQVVFEVLSSVEDINPALAIIDSLNIHPELLYDKKFIISKKYSLGQIEKVFDEFIQARSDYFIAKDFTSKKKEKDLLKNYSVKKTRDLIKSIERQNIIIKENIENERKNLTLYEDLLKDGYITQNTLNQSKEKIAHLELSLSENKINVKKTAINLQDIENNISELDAQISIDTITTRRNLQIAYSLFINEVKNWSYKYIVYSPMAGVLHYTENWSNGVFLEDITELGAITPLEIKKVYSVGTIKTLKSGNIMKGLKVKISLNGYNSTEFGYVAGTISEISPIIQKTSTDEFYYKIKIDLVDGLKTSNGITLSFKPELDGVAKIETERISIAKRFFNRAKSKFEVLQ